MEEIFRDVYRNNIWGDPETVSGHGSGVARTAAFRDQFANLAVASGAHRGYVRLEVTRDRLHADLIALDTVKQPESPRRVLKSFDVESGRPQLLT